MSQTTISTHRVMTGQVLSNNREEVTSGSAVLQLAQMLHGVVTLFPTAIPNPLSESQRPDTRVTEIVEERLNKWGYTIDTFPYKKALKTGFIIATAAYQHTPAQVQAEIVLYTYIVTLIDDEVVDIAAMEQFVPRLCSRSTQLHPVLDQYVEVCDELAKHYTVYGSNVIFTNSVEFVNSELLLLDDKSKPFGSLHRGSVPYLMFMRDQTGITRAYGAFIWPKSNFPEVSEYIQAFPETADAIYLINDIFSYYKELKSGEVSTFVVGLATAKSTTELEEVRGLINRAHALFVHVRELLGTGKARDAWEDFMAGYIRFHLSDPRYKLAEILPGLNIEY